MKNGYQELEVKFYLSDMQRLERRLQSLGATPDQPRTHEINLRFDTPDRHLTQSLQVLRLRKDTAARLTYKGPGETRQGVRLRQEIEFEVSDYEAARLLLVTLGFEISMMYEKFRATYILGNVHVTLDEMPYGYFAEIEGPDPAGIQQASQQLGLDWERRVLDSYTALFDRLGMPFRDLSFANFQSITILPEQLQLAPADL